MAGDLELLADRPGWVVDGPVATFCPVDGRWCARIRYMQAPGHTYQRIHIAVIDNTGTAQYTMTATTVAEAVRVAEGQVRGRPVG